MAAMQVDLTRRFGFAEAFAFTLHNGQRRKGNGVPYYAHLMAVTATVLDFGGSEDAAIAAMLHDAVEDQGGSRILREIEARYGKHVAQVVLTVSDCVDPPKPPWSRRKADYVKRLAAGSRDAKIVAAADKLHNLRCTVADVREQGPAAMLKFNAPAVDLVAYYGACIGAVAGDIPKGLLEALDWTLAELRMLLSLPQPSAFRSGAPA